MTEEDVPNTTFLKWVVTILGIMIVAVAVAIGVILYQRAMATTEPAEVQGAAEVPLSTTGAKAVPFGTVDVALPDNMVVTQTAYDAGRIIVTYGSDEADIQGMMILDATSGIILGQFVFSP
jgi:uncharacterized protein YpmB